MRTTVMLATCSILFTSLALAAPFSQDANHGSNPSVKRDDVPLFQAQQDKWHNLPASYKPASGDGVAVGRRAAWIEDAQGQSTVDKPTTTEGPLEEDCHTSYALGLQERCLGGPGLG